MVELDRRMEIIYSQLSGLAESRQRVGQKISLLENQGWIPDMNSLWMDADATEDLRPQSEPRQDETPTQTGNKTMPDGLAGCPENSVSV